MTFIVYNNDGFVGLFSWGFTNNYIAISQNRQVIFTFHVDGAQTLTGVVQTLSGRNVYIDWGDGSAQETFTGTSDQAYSHVYSGAATFRIYADNESYLTKFTRTNTLGNISGTLSLPSGMTYFRCAGSNTFSGVLSLPSGMTYFYCTGSNTLSGVLSLPSGMTYFLCTGSNTLSGTLSLPSGMLYFYCTGSNTLSGALSLPSGMTYLLCTGSNTFSGTLSLPSGMTYFLCTGSNTFSGTLSLPSVMSYFYCSGSNTLSGTLSLPSGMTYFLCTGSNTLSGTLSLPSVMTYFYCTGSNTLSGYVSSAKAPNQKRFKVIINLGSGLSSADVDQILIDYAAAGGTWVLDKLVSITGSVVGARTSASDAAVATLQSKGVTVITN